MTALFIVASAIALFFFGIALFLGKEMFKKFRFMRDFANTGRSLLEFRYKGAREHGWKKGMRNIVIHWNRPFSVLVGFELTAPVFGTGFDYYGYAESRKGGGEHFVVISTYLGNGPCLFRFLLNRPVDETATAIDNSPPAVSSDDHLDQALVPSVVYPPHFYQKLGFYA